METLVEGFHYIRVKRGSWLYLRLMAENAKFFEVQTRHVFQRSEVHMSSCFLNGGTLLRARNCFLDSAMSS